VLPGLKHPLSLKLPGVLMSPRVWLLLPAMFLLVVFFFFPLLNVIRYSFYTQVPGGPMQPHVTLHNFEKFFAHELYGKILLRTLFNALMTTLLASGMRFIFSGNRSIS
jgi:ABC-type spermidine/putrescine transport system permease subunit I